MSGGQMSGGQMSGSAHVPVLLDEAIAALAVQPGTVVIDATFGAGGYGPCL
jgi:16S rRNA (cytosine1402-N4)-methyltransferase